MKLILAITAVVFFLLSGFQVKASVNWDGLGKACVVAALMLPL